MHHWPSTHPQQPPRQPSHAPRKKRKLVWTRSDGAQPSGDGPQSAEPLPAVAPRQHQKQRQGPARRLDSSGTQASEHNDVLAEAEALRQQVAARQQELLKGRQDVQQQRAKRAKQLQEETEQRKARRSRLEAGFAQALSEASAAAASSPATKAATAEEVERVVSSRTDHEVLQVSPGASAAVIRKRYRDLAVSLHPDKCSEPRATLAFQRLVAAHDALSKHAV